MHPNEALARHEVDVVSRGDLAALQRLYTDDCVFHYPGRSRLAGEHRGVDAFLARLEEVFAEVAISRELHDALGTDDHEVQLLRVSATAGHRSHSWRAVWVMHIRDGRFAEAWACIDDQYASTSSST